MGELGSCQSYKECQVAVKKQHSRNATLTNISSRQTLHAHPSVHRHGVPYITSHQENLPYSHQCCNSSSARVCSSATAKSLSEPQRGTAERSALLHTSINTFQAYFCSPCSANKVVIVGLHRSNCFRHTQCDLQHGKNIGPV